MPKVTIDDVAELAGVSIKTVSRVVNQEPNVREATRARVDAAIAKLNYQPNKAARNLASHHSHLIGLIYDDPSYYEIPSAGYVIRMQQGALSACHASNYELLIIDEFGFDKIERAESAQAASLLYKVVDSRAPEQSTALVTNISFEAWADYLGDAPLAMAILDRLVDGAIVLKIEGRSYRAHRAQQPAKPPPAETPKPQRRRKPPG